MRILYIYTEFLDNRGNSVVYRGMRHFEVNLGREQFFHYKDGKLCVSKIKQSVPEGFWGKNIYNISTLAGDNGSGKSTILSCIMNLLRRIYDGRIVEPHKCIMIIENEGHKAALFAPGKGTENLEIENAEICIYRMPAYKQLSMDWVSEAIMRTKIIYLTNTLNEEDYWRAKIGYGESHWKLKRYTHVRNQFLYDCSICGLMLSDYRNDIDRKRYQRGNEENWLNIFFTYEKYKQVKYVFDKKQYSILKKLKDQGYPVPVPKQLRVSMLPADFNLIFSKEPKLVGFRTKSKEKEMLFPKAAKQMNIWEKHIEEKNAVDESVFFTDVLLYGLGCNCVLSLLRSILLNLNEEKKNIFINRLRYMMENNAQKVVVAGMMENEFLYPILKSIEIYRSLAEDKNSYLYRGERYYTDFIHFIFQKREELLKHLRVEVSVRDYYGADMGDFPFYVAIDEAEWFGEFLQKYRYTCNPHYYLNFSWGLSSGENNLLGLFTSLYYIFEKDYANKKNGMCKIYNLDKMGKRITCETILLVMDEADLTYHPDWQRRFISVITAFLQEIYPPECCKEIQILLSTHSPLLLGDMPHHNVIYLTTNEKNGESKVENSGVIETFGQNIHLILRDSFFLKKGTIGEFAGKKIQEIVDGLESIRRHLEEWETGKAEVEEEKADENICKIEKEFYPVITLLADGIIKNKLIEISSEYVKRLEKLKKPVDEYADMTLEQLNDEMRRIIKEMERRRKD